MAPSDREFSRIHGLSLPLHPLQILIWIFILCFSVLVFTTTIPAFLIHIQIILFILLGFGLLLMTIALGWSTLIDPADDMVRKKFAQGNDLHVETLNRNKHNHVIENAFCNLCNVPISNDRTKHCRSCNKCVKEFDHHCKWLNNCVGSRNYKQFFAALAIGAILLLMIFTTSLFVFICYFTDIHHGHQLQPFYDYYSTKNSSLLNITSVSNTYGTGLFVILYKKVGDMAWLCVVMLIIIAATIADGFLFELLFFHIYLWRHNKSTYQYIVEEREKEQTKKQNSKESQSNQMPKFKTNTVQPMRSNSNEVYPNPQFSSTSQLAKPHIQQSGASSSSQKDIQESAISFGTFPNETNHLELLNGTRGGGGGGPLTERENAFQKSHPSDYYNRPQSFHHHHLQSETHIEENNSKSTLSRGTDETDIQTISSHFTTATIDSLSRLPPLKNTHLPNPSLLRDLDVFSASSYEHYSDHHPRL